MGSQGKGMLYLIVRTAARRDPSSSSSFFSENSTSLCSSEVGDKVLLTSQESLEEQLQDQEKRRNAERCVAPALLDYTIFGIGEAQFSLEHQTY